MQLRKFRWSKVYESSEEELQDFLQARAIAAERFHLDELDGTELPAQDEPSTIWCAEGSLQISFGDNSGPMQPGDGLQLPAGQAVKIDAGISGCGYYLSR